jgi:hypothetical protein
MPRGALHEPRDARAAAGCGSGVSLDAMLVADHPLRRLGADAREPAVTRPAVGVLLRRQRRLVMTHAISDPKGDLVGVMLIARNVAIS